MEIDNFTLIEICDNIHRLCVSDRGLDLVT